jgi:hypothetical protein
MGKSVLAVAALIVILACSPGAAANLVFNGEFDNPAVLGWGASYGEGQWYWWYGPGCGSAQDLNGYNTSCITPPSAIVIGGFAVDPNTQRIALGIIQDVVVQANTGYLLSAWMRCDGVNAGQPFDGTNPNAYIHMSYNTFDGSTWSGEVGVGTVNDASLGWVECSTTLFTGPSTNVVRIGFMTVVPEGINDGHWAYTQIDHVVLQVPEPSGAAALASMILPFGLMLRRRSGH